MNALIYQPGDLGYRRPNPFSNPYEKRSLAAPVRYGLGNDSTQSNGISGPKCHRLQEKIYHFFFHNHHSLYRSQRRVLHLNTNRKIQGRLNWVEALPGNPARTNFLLKRYLQLFVKRCQLDPTRFETMAVQLYHTCKDLELHIPTVRAFAAIPHLDDLLQLLKSLLQKTGAFQFELAVAAIFQFAGLEGED